MQRRRRTKQRHLSPILVFFIGSLTGFYVCGLLFGRKAITAGTISVRAVREKLWIGPDTIPFDKNSAARNAKNLIIVAGHRYSSTAFFN